MATIETGFIAYRHTGEDPEVLGPMLTAVRDELGRIGIEAYCTFFDEAQFQSKSLGPRAIMAHAFEMIEARDMLFVILAGDAKSEGMIMEVGRFFGRLPIVMAVREGLGYTYLPDMADVTYTWATNSDLVAGIEPAVAQLQQ